MENHNSSSKKRKMCDRRSDQEDEKDRIREVVGRLGEELQQKMQAELEQLAASLLSKMDMDRDRRRNNTGKQKWIK